MASYMAKRRSVRRAKLIALHHGRCIKCGSGENLEFDHRDRTERLFSLSGAGLDKAWTKILAEAEKCDLLVMSIIEKRPVNATKPGEVTISWLTITEQRQDIQTMPAGVMLAVKRGMTSRCSEARYRGLEVGTR